MDVRLQSLREDDGRPLEWRLTEDASVLGRVLYTWTGVRGDKSESAAVFPRYIQFAPVWVARAFCQICVQQRGMYRDDRGEFIQITAKRSDRLRQQLADTVRRVVSDPDAIRATSWPLRIYEPPLSELREYP